MTEINELKISYCQASRCWQSNNLKACLRICNSLTRGLDDCASRNCDGNDKELMQLRHLTWMLRIKCITEEYYVNESFLLNEDDIESDDKVETIHASATVSQVGGVRPTTAQPSLRSRALSGSSRRKLTNGSRIDTRLQHTRTAMLTGKMPSRSGSRQTSGQATSSYRPLTTSLTATQTAFSRSTRPLLKYSTCQYLAKPIYEYLYNAQSITNICPDHRQCLEYLNLVRSSRRRHQQDKGHMGLFEQHSKNRDSFELATNQNISSDQVLIMLSGREESSDKYILGGYWSISFGICYFHLKMHKQAEEFFQTSASASSKSLDPYLWLIKVYLRLSQPIKVLRTCERGLVHSRNAILYNWKARVQSLLNESMAAHRSLRELLHYCPTNIEALANVGHYSFYSDKFEQALKCFERINLLSMNCGCGTSLADGSELSVVNTMTTDDSSAELYNNMAVCNFHCGYYSKVMPLFQRAFLRSSNKEVTSNIWYNISFIPLSFGAKNLAIACLRLALKNDSQNEEAINNLGVLRYEALINDPLHYCNKQEYWGCEPVSRSSMGELKNIENSARIRAQYDAAETLFGAPKVAKRDVHDATEDGYRQRHKQVDEADDDNDDDVNSGQPEMLFNMALVKRKRGQLLASVKYCNSYLQYDYDNHTIKSILTEIRDLVSHDS